MQLTTLKEYARQKGVTYEAVRKQIVRYKDELGEHLVRDGRQQLLDEDAVKFLDEHREKNPVIVFQQNKDEELKTLREKNTRLLERNIELMEENHAHKAQSDRIKLLEESNAAQEAQIRALSDENSTLRDNIAQSDKIAQNANMRLLEASKEFEDKEHRMKTEIEQLRQQLADEKERPLTWRERLFGKKS